VAKTLDTEKYARSGVQRRVTTLVEFAREVVAAARRHGEENVYALGYRKPRARA
jgi:hypothetical protein